MVKIIVFDFDGVIVRGSEFGKDKAWEHIFPQEVMENVDLAKKKYSGGKGSRFDIIRDLAPIVGIKLEDVGEWVAKKAKEFGNFTFAFTIREGVLPEDREALEFLSGKYPLYLNSATPEPVLQSIAETLQIAQFFRGIYGQRNSRSKVENLERAAGDADISPSEILFVGDTDGDFEASKTFGCSFVGIMNDWNKWQEGDKSFPLISGLKDLLKEIRPI